MARIEMTGLAELQARLSQMANATNIEKDALTEAGEHLRKEIQNNVPVRTGKLKESITKDEVVDGKIQIGPSQQGPAFRAHFVEFGTRKMSARPFMRPTFEREKTRIEQIMAEQIRRGLGL
ncbi:HK97-gp10 family putative phage morphogenesis protein [Sporosarcina sp. E16_8]|uniref:HK97-gp10 family putative phage morphogenesis protein n=1 Tax=Sporosarcina sp. E16_8 TaxID=2789295 RepID=UPI001A9351A7|nr:HK97-gp10 family putative phage morphogenesis protein [Sporosarcina sp. E16_8]MBO0586118.1 HK97 gp10 family phage protein [Sporosarcina sp. E16_8]